MNFIPELKVGDHAPETTVLDENGQVIELSSTWKQGKPVLLTFLRHFG